MHTSLILPTKYSHDTSLTCKVLMQVFVVLDIEDELYNNYHTFRMASSLLAVHTSIRGSSWILAGSHFNILLLQA